jgi:hypothetical protein
MKKGAEILPVSSCVVRYGSIVRQYSIPEYTENPFLNCPLIRTNNP